MVRQNDICNRSEGDLAMLIYRGVNGPGVDDKGRIFGETGEADASDTQRRADSEFWRIATTKRPRIKLLIIVVQGEIRRIWQVFPEGKWSEENGKVGLPLGEHPLTLDEVRRLYPALGMAVGDWLSRQRGKMREYIPVEGLK